eukprot:TRINITY_DN6820_c0_g1_i19.p2 TRINITY_DN6820_c0_g1~~TRINITY_DN6820_c0_g1_i19.p2  ORF type:complete len:195 (-),score=47.36 TRINITY_DN6820_c0_g1_i19:858-1442(-)
MSDTVEELIHRSLDQDKVGQNQEAVAHSEKNHLILQAMKNVQSSSINRWRQAQRKVAGAPEGAQKAVAAKHQAKHEQTKKDVLRQALKNVKSSASVQKMVRELQRRKAHSAEHQKDKRQAAKNEQTKKDVLRHALKNVQSPASVQRVAQQPQPKKMHASGQQKDNRQAKNNAVVASSPQNLDASRRRRTSFAKP